jgi:hypothetical protein
MLLTALVSQHEIGPNVVAVVGLAIQSLTAVWMLSSVTHAGIKDFPQLQTGYAARNVAPHSMYIAYLVAYESASAVSKADATLATRRTFQPAMFELKADAILNVPAMFETLATFQPAIFELKVSAEANVNHMVATLAVFHFEMSALKTAASWKAADMHVADAVFQLEMSWLKADAM